jgi:signal transduction histidine kinase
LLSQTIICKAAGAVSFLYVNRKISTKILLLFLGHLLICFVLAVLTFSGGMPVMAVPLVLVCIIEGVVLIRDAVQRQWLKDGIERIAGGELSYKIDTEKLSGLNTEVADAINNIGDGLYHAVDESMKNERLKTDLITNVSHDIKTPLTSIINYVDLLQREQIDDPKVQEYLKILEAKSQRLKQLTEDLVEASKVSSGNVKLNFERLNFVELVNQTSGEFAEKFEAAGLIEVKKCPDEPVVIRADGRSLFRVIENLYNNTAKYALAHTRVYVDLKVEGTMAVFSIKNVSRQELNIKAEELTERFVRGDISRSTEGSGLGLSIASNLTELMHGTFEIYLDGDLFKVTVQFPVINQL